MMQRALGLVLLLIVNVLALSSLQAEEVGIAVGYRHKHIEVAFNDTATIYFTVINTGDVEINITVEAEVPETLAVGLYPWFYSRVLPEEVVYFQLNVSPVVDESLNTTISLQFVAMPLTGQVRIGTSVGLSLSVYVGSDANTTKESAPTNFTVITEAPVPKAPAWTLPLLLFLMLIAGVVIWVFAFGGKRKIAEWWRMWRERKR